MNVKHEYRLVMGDEDIHDLITALEEKQQKLKSTVVNPPNSNSVSSIEESLNRLNALLNQIKSFRNYGGNVTISSGSCISGCGGQVMFR